MNETPSHSEASVTPSDTEAQLHPFFPPPYRISDRPSPTKRARHASHTPSRPPSRGPSLTPSDVGHAREASALRLFDAWTSIAERYTGNLGEDDEVDLRTGEVITDGGFLRKAPLVEFGHFIEPDEPERSDSTAYDEEPEEDDVDELDAFAESRRVGGWIVPPLRKVDPLDAKELEEFLQAEKELQESRREQEVSDGDGEHEEEEEEVASGSTFDSGDEFSIELKDPGEDDPGFPASTQAPTPSKSTEWRTIPDDPATRRAISPQPRQPVASSSRHTTNDDSDDEFGAWVHDEASAVYRVQKPGESVVSDEELFHDEDEEFEFAEPPPPSSSVPSSPVKADRYSTFIDLTLDDDDECPPLITPTSPSKDARGRPLSKPPLQLATPPRSTSFAFSPPPATVSSRNTSIAKSALTALNGKDPRRQEGRSVITEPKPNLNALASELLERHTRSTSKPRPSFSKRLEPEVVIPLRTSTPIRPTGSSKRANSLKLTRDQISLPSSSSKKMNSLSVSAALSTHPCDTPTTLESGLPTPPPMPENAPNERQAPVKSRKGKEKEVFLDDISVEPDPPHRTPLDKRLFISREQAGITASARARSNDRKPHQFNEHSLSRTPVSPKTPRKRRRSPTQSPQSVEPPSPPHHTRLGHNTQTPSPKTRSRSLPRSHRARSRESLHPASTRVPATAPTELGYPPYSTPYPPPAYGFANDPRVAYILTQALAQISSLQATDHLSPTMPSLLTHPGGHYPPRAPSIPLYRSNSYPYLYDSSLSGGSVLPSSISPENSPSAKATAPGRPGALVARSRSRGRRVSFYDMKSAAFQKQNDLGSDSESGTAPKFPPTSHTNHRPSDGAKRFPSPAVDEVDDKQPGQRGRPMERGQTPGPAMPSTGSHTPRRSTSKLAKRGPN